MTFDFIGTRFERLVMFCRQAARIQQTPDLISFVAGETDYVGFCRIITNPDDIFKKRFTAMCRANQMDPDDIRRRMQLVASVLGIYKQVDYYRILDVTPNADEQAIKQAYRKKAQIFHPDKAAGDVENSEAFIKLHDAYVHLSDPMVRQLYDPSRDGSGDWVEGKKSSQMPAWGVGFGRFLSWMLVVIGSVIIVSYAFDIYNNGSIAFFFEQLPRDQMDEPELMSKQQLNRGQQAAAMEMVTNKIQNPNSVPALETESETSDKPATQADKGKPIKKHVFAKEQLRQKQNMQIVQRASESKKTVARLLNKMAKVPTVKKNVITRIKTKEVKYIHEQRRLLAFLKKYTSTYEQKDLHRFRTFFVKDALEQGRPFETLLPTYQQTFNKVEALRYHIDLKSFTIDSSAKKILIEGIYTASYRLPEKDWGNSSGTIRMELLDSSGGLMVSRLEYDKGNR